MNLGRRLFSALSCAILLPIAHLLIAHGALADTTPDCVATRDRELASLDRTTRQAREELDFKEPLLAALSLKPVELERQLRELEGRERALPARYAKFELHAKGRLEAGVPEKLRLDSDRIEREQIAQDEAEVKTRLRALRAARALQRQGRAVERSKLLAREISTANGVMTGFEPAKQGIHAQYHACIIQNQGLADPRSASRSELKPLTPAGSAGSSEPACGAYSAGSR